MRTEEVEQLAGLWEEWKVEVCYVMCSSRDRCRECDGCLDFDDLSTLIDQAMGELG